MILLESDFYLNQWMNVVREMLMNVLLKLCMQLVHLWCSQAMCIGRDFWMFFAQHTPLQTDMLYLLICWMQFNIVQVKVKQIIEKADCIAIISDGCSNVRGQGIINYMISTPQTVSLHCRWAEGSYQRSWATAGICTGDRQCCEHEGCLV